MKNIRTYLPVWLNVLIPFFGFQRLSRLEVLELNLDRFRKWEGFYVGFPARPDELANKGKRLYVRAVKSPKTPTNPPMVPA